MTWPDRFPPDRYPGKVRREITVESQATEEGQLAFTAVLRDRWLGEDGAEEPIHGYEIHLVADPPDLTVVSIDVQPRFLPFPDCPSAALAAQRLVGLQLTKGFRAAATKVLGHVEGCTHLLTLVLAIWNEQVVTRYMLTRSQNPDDSPDPDAVADVCAGWREGGVGITLVREGRPMPRSVDYGADD